MSDSFDQLRSAPSSAPASASSGVSSSGPPAPPRRLFTRVVVPAALLLGALLVLGIASRDLWRPVVLVKMEPVLVRDQGGGVAEGGSVQATGIGIPVAKAAGWIEPSPYPVYAAALASGVIEKITVLEGQKVVAGQTVAELVKADAEIALRQAQADVAGAKAKVEAAKSAIAETTAFEAQLAPETAAMEADLAALRDKAGRLEGARQSGAVVEADLVQQKLAVAAKEKALEALRADAPVRGARVASAKAAAAGADADLSGAEAREAAAHLRLERMTVRAPSAGVVMRLLKSPGDEAMPESIMPRSAQIAALYDPEKLQMRVDVPFSLVARVHVGQACEVVADALPARKFKGRVARFVHEADLQKNTVQVKVELAEVAPELKPEMLATAQFFAGGRETGAAPAAGHAAHAAPLGTGALPEATSASAVFIRPEWLSVRHEGHGVAWVARPVGGGAARAEQAELRLGGASADGFVQVLDGLNPGDRVITGPWEKLSDGIRVKEDADHAAH